MYSKFRRTQWCEAAELKDKARLDSVSGKEAAAWVTALPKHYSSKVEPRTFRTMVSYRLRLPLPGITHAQCTCRSNGKNHGHIDPEGYHLTAGCKLGGHQIATHDFIVLTYAQMLRQAGFMTQREVRYSFHDDTNKRPDLIVENYITGRTCFDVSVIHPHSILRGRANLKPGDAARTRGQAKIDKYRALAADAGMQFFPVVHESYGRLGAAAEKLLRICADRIAASKRIPKASVLFYWRSRLSILLQKMLARASQERLLNLNNPSLRGGEDECFQVELREINRVDDSPKPQIVE